MNDDLPNILGIDPGTTESAYVILGNGRIFDHAKLPNHDMRRVLLSFANAMNCTLALEMVASYGKPVGKEVFQTALWIGRFIECWSGPHVLIERPDVKLHLCHSRSKVTDGVIRQALIDRFGPGKEAAIGKKKNPGPLYRIRADEWQALALAITAQDRMAAEPTRAGRDNH